MKSRKLNPREREMRDKHTRLVEFPVSYAVFLWFDVQSFQIGGNFETRKEAEWTRDMLAIALSKVEL